ncbi:helix-turn-helix domain-containing protein [Halorubrum sp. Boch-26]|uniref:winged helix-turn-helix transcriptional regulator n=1 Tax=Halorubrum sp. Boch-26 TaxID=2994426 RepID=UPI002468C0CE|nr:helix-turn-helix domain-containing protein [Halorubrum sp. Boch-26]
MSTERIPISRLDGSHERTQRLLIEVADVLGHKWHPVILTQLLSGEPHTFSELGAAIDDVSNKMLSDSLSTLEERGLVDREVVSEKPVRVRYTLTRRGRELEAVLDPMLRWGREHLAADAVDRSREPAGPRLPGHPGEEGVADE